MTNLLTAVFAVALLILGVASLTEATLSSASDVSGAWANMAERHLAAIRTDVSLVTADVAGSGTNVDIKLLNSGQTVLGTFTSWDLVIEYYKTSTNQGLAISWLSYTSSSTPLNGEWTVNAIYANSNFVDAEVYDPNIFNPNEGMIIRLKITPEIPTSTANLVTIGTPNGVTVAAPFSR